MATSIFDIKLPTRTALCFLSVLATVLTIVSTSQAQTLSVLHYFTGGTDGQNPTSGVTIGGPGTIYGTAQGSQSQFGAAFKLTEKGSGWTLNPLHTFTGESDGAYPSAGLVIGPNGALYGTTFAGAFGVGTIYELRPPATACKTALCYWDLTVLHGFTGNVSDGGHPGYGNVTFDQAGNMYGTTTLNGADGCGVVWKLTPSGGGWTETVVYNFTGGTDGCNPEAGVIFDSAGNMYGATACQYLCHQGTGAIYQLTPANGGWTENTLVTLNASTGTHPWGTLIADGAGNFYGTATEDGPNGGGTVFELSPSGGGWNFSLVYGFSACLPSAGVTLGPDGNLYGVCFSGGANAAGWLFKMPRNCNQNCTATDLHDFIPGEGGNPIGPVVFDASGNIYGTSYDGGIGDCIVDPIQGCGTVWKFTP